RMLHDLRDAHPKRSGQRGKGQNQHGQNGDHQTAAVDGHGRSLLLQKFRGPVPAPPRPRRERAGPARQVPRASPPDDPQLGAAPSPFHSCRLLTVFITSDVSLPTTPGVARRRRVRKSYSSSLEPTTTSRMKSYVPAHAAA